MSPSASESQLTHLPSCDRRARSKVKHNLLLNSVNSFTIKGLVSPLNYNSIENPHPQAGEGCFSAGSIHS